MTNHSRTFRIRNALGESQADFAPRLRLSQASVARLETGQDETGPVSLLLDQIEADFAAGRLSPKGASAAPEATSETVEQGL